MTNNGAVCYIRVATAEQLRGFKAGLHDGMASHGNEESNVNVEKQEETQKGREDK